MKGFKFILKCLLALAIALVLGIGSAVYGVIKIARSQAIQNGAWHTNLSLGTKQAGIYTRAAVTIGGLGALTKEEAIYYIAFEDDDGEWLRSSCDYVLEGKDMDARWWSITVYGSDHFLIPNKQNRWAHSVMSVAREPDNSYKIHLSSSEKEGNWIPTGEKGKKFSVALRVYNPGKSIYEHPDTVDVPSIQKESCK